MNATGEWVLRHAGGCLIDIPDLPIPATRIAWRWIATLWPDALCDDGFAALDWEEDHAAGRSPSRCQSVMSSNSASRRMILPVRRSRPAHTVGTGGSTTRPNSG